MLRMRTCVVLLTSFLLAGPAAAVTILGPAFPPVGETMTFSGSGAQGDVGGRTWTFGAPSNVTGWTDLYWGPSSLSLPQAALDGSLDPLSLAGISGDTATWTGTTSWDNPDTLAVSYAPVPVELRIQIGGLGANPWLLATSVAGLDPGPGAGIGAVVETFGSGFTANIRFLADLPTDGIGNFIAMNAVEQLPNPPAQTLTSYGGAFYSVVPEPGTAALLALGCAGLAGGRRRQA